MISYYFQGLALGAAMILPLGPQNAFVMNQGIRRQYHIMIALLCAISDLLLICAGIFGGSALLMQSPWLLALVTWGGVAFLLWYGFGAWQSGRTTGCRTQTLVRARHRQCLLPVVLRLGAAGGVARAATAYRKSAADYQYAGGAGDVVHRFSTGKRRRCACSRLVQFRASPLAL